LNQPIPGSPKVICHPDPILDSIRKTIKKISPDVKVSSDEIKEILILEVLKREVFDDEKSEEARKKISKTFKAGTRKENTQ
jgi:hypothetical protein